MKFFQQTPFYSDLTYFTDLLHPLLPLPLLFKNRKGNKKETNDNFGWLIIVVAFIEILVKVFFVFFHN